VKLLEVLKENDLIKIICKNGLIEEGRFVFIDNECLIIKLIDNSVYSILNPFDNIVAIKILNVDNVPDNVTNVYIDKEPEPVTYIPDPQLRAKSIAELHKLKAFEERKRAQEALKSHKISKNIKSEEYLVYPDLTNSNLFKHSTKKT
jgi:hypothetical protein